MHPFLIPSETLLSLINSRQCSFFRDSVRNLLLVHRVAAEEAAIVAACSGIENLFLSAQTSLVVLGIQFDRPLKRLHADLNGIFGSDTIDFTHPVLASLTHLEIFNLPDVEFDLRIWTALTGLPHLTHLAFADEDYLTICGSLLPSWECLQVLVILFHRYFGNLDANRLTEHNVPELADEPRLVLMIIPEDLYDWINGAHTGSGDYWSRAESHIAKQRSGQVNRKSYDLHKVYYHALVRDSYAPDNENLFQED
ncbi:hypothetical protein MSAN_00142200 [Mycena sanguinolenta]|uniref:Uncharacterized protein n=1 Tax=Mycena sanguinolenta TaxID=230812 RepID=A0A8H6ZDV6_9AGAR|nr:hypothetical protein MSAN_00142200 [Mycena sanguinolenta]